MPTTTAPRRIMKFDPTVNTGTIIQTLVFVMSVAVAYGAYREDQTRQDGRITQAEYLAVMRQRWEQGDKSVPSELMRVLQEWLVAHIVKMDKQYGPHLK